MIREIIHLLRETRAQLLKGIIPGHFYETDYDNGAYTACVVIAPKREKVMGFERMWADIKSHYGSSLVPAYILVSNGSKGSYFVVFIRK